MPVVSNGLYSNPDMGSIVSNLGTAIWGSPEARMKRDYYNAESEDARARAGKVSEQTRGLKIQNDALADVGPIGSVFMRATGETPDAFRVRVAPMLGRILQAGGGNASELASGLNTVLGSIYALGNDDDMRRSLVIGGKMPTDKFAGTAQRADDVAARDADALYRKDTKVADIKAGADRDVATINNNGALARVYAAPIVAKRGEDTYLAADDPRRRSIGTDGVVHGAPTVDSVRADAGQKILDLAPDQAPGSNLANVFSGGAGYKGTMAKPAAVTGKALDDAVLAGARMVPGATTQNGGKYALVPEFEQTLGADKVAAARNAAATTYAQTRDVQKAGQAYLGALGIQPGDSFAKGGWLSDSRIVKYQPTSAAPPAAAAPIQIPPAPQREIGKTYPTPKGDLEWTGTGWRVPTAKGPVY